MLRKIIKKYLRRRHHRLIKSEMKGAKKLIEQDRPNFVNLLVDELRTVHLNIDYKSLNNRVFSKNNSGSVEQLTRQLLYKKKGHIYAEIMRHINIQKPISAPIPPELILYLEN